MKHLFKIVCLLFVFLSNAAQKDNCNLQDITTIFCHGIGSSKKAGFIRHAHHPDNRCGAHAPFIGQLHAFDFKDTQDSKDSCLGQEEDVKLLAQQVKDFNCYNLAGSSRGAFAIINFLGTYKPDNVLVAFLESPSANLNEIAYNELAKKTYLGFLANTRIGKWLARKVMQYKFSCYNPNGLQAIDTIANIPFTTATLMFGSIQDTLIPPTQNIKLYRKQIEAGHPNAYLIIVDHGKHSHILQDKQGYMIRDAYHALLCATGQAHNPAWAQRGKIYLKKYTLQELDELEKEVVQKLQQQKK